MIETLAGLVLPDEAGVRRAHIIPASQRPEGYDASYDFHTLFYDAVAMPGAVWLFCPKLQNFRALPGGITIDGKPVRLGRIRRFERHDIVELPCTGAPERLEIAVGAWRGGVAISRCDRATFAGRNVLVTLSRNNDLAWIRDWVLFHQREHGADAVLFFDNGSTAYGVAEIEAMLADLGVVAVVVSAPFPFGPNGGARRKFAANFLQAGILNLARHRFLGPARAVLQCDVDELVLRRGGESVFDAAVGSRAGFLRFGGEWRFPVATGAMPLHRDHYLRGPEGRSSPQKYCIVPDGPMRRRAWATHGLQGVWFGGRFVSDRFGFLHCYGISDFWKGRPKGEAERAREMDPEAREVLVRAFGTAA